MTSLRTLRRATALLLALCMLAGCSIVAPVYTRLDLLATAEADRWLDLDREQKRHFRGAMRERLEWHQREELPGWAALLEASATLIETGPGAADLLETIDAGRELLRGTTRGTLEPIAATLARLRPEQVERLALEFERDNAEYAEEFLEGAPAERAERRRERARKAIERWTGRLDAAQRAELAQIVDSFPDGARQWQAYRLAWQAELLAALRGRRDATELEALLVRWWVEDSAMDPDDIARSQRNRELIAEGGATLIATLRPEQRGRAAGRLRSLARELTTLNETILATAVGD